MHAADVCRQRARPLRGSLAGIPARMVGAGPARMPDCICNASGAAVNADAPRAVACRWSDIGGTGSPVGAGAMTGFQVSAPDAVLTGGVRLASMRYGVHPNL